MVYEKKKAYSSCKSPPPATSFFLWLPGEILKNIPLDVTNEPNRNTISGEKGSLALTEKPRKKRNSVTNEPNRNTITRASKIPITTMERAICILSWCLGNFDALTCGKREKMWRGNFQLSLLPYYPYIPIPPLVEADGHLRSP
jgi:hypothetical protein